MGPTIILDKSTLQSLSRDEVETLTRFYIVNVPPVLIHEINADLAKAPRAGRSAAREVAALAGKLTMRSPGTNTPYLTLIGASLAGDEIPINGQIPIAGGKQVRTKSGDDMLYIPPSPEQKTLREWQMGKFSSGDEAQATAWRESAKEIDLERLRRDARASVTDWTSARDLNQLVGLVDQMLGSTENQDAAMRDIVTAYIHRPNVASTIYHRWEGMPDGSLVSAFAPYAGFCFRALLLFQMGIANDLLGTRPTNLVDLQYLYYLPFCFVFSSGDKFHKTLAPWLLRENQFFVDGMELKRDLARISEVLDPKDPLPPALPDSITYKIASSLIPDIEQRRRDKPLKLSPEREREEVRKMKAMVEEAKAADPEPGQLDDPRYIVREWVSGPDDPCPCGSAKKLRDCCEHLLDAADDDPG